MHSGEVYSYVRTVTYTHMTYFHGFCEILADLMVKLMQFVHNFDGILFHRLIITDFASFDIHLVRYICLIFSYTTNNVNVILASLVIVIIF